MRKLDARGRDVAGRYAAAFKDVESVALPALRHRIIRSFEAEADGVTTDDIVARLLESVGFSHG